MVKADMLYQLNLRLQEIMQNSLPFGNVCVLLVGDLMQLKPIRARWIFECPSAPQFYETYCTSNLWRLFKSIELIVKGVTLYMQQCLTESELVAIIPMIY
jgi:hypothetical protein